jgi:hypothetical protein
VRPLLKDDKPGILFTAVDNTGQANVNEYSSLYLGGMHNRKNVLLGRQRSELESDTDQWVNGYVSEIEFANMAPIDFSSYGLIQDVSHRPSQSANDLLYILQGGGSLNWMAPASEGSEQYLHIGAQNQNISTFSLEQLGLNNIEGDNYGYQSVVYVPASESHGEKLVIGGLAGAWISELDGQGMPIKFEAMNWEGLESETAPGSYIKAMKYNPQDDLLILGTQGQGSWIYSFTGDIGERPRASELLHMSNVSLAQGDQPQLDKRGNQFNETIAIQLDSRLQDKNESTNIEIVLHNPDKWRKYMSMVSPYYVGEDGDAFTESVREQASNWYNILEPYGLKYRGGWETKQEIVMPFEFRPGISMFNLSINAKDFAHFSPAKLSYSVRTTDGKESITRRLKLISTLDAFKPLNTTDQLSSASDDNIIHHQSAKEALAKVSLTDNTLEMDLNHSYLDSGLRNNLASNIAPWSDLAIASGLTNESLLF